MYWSVASQGRDGGTYCASLAYPRLDSLGVDVTLAREKDDWSKPWTAQDLPQLPTHKSLSRMIVALSLADRDYNWMHEGLEHPCGGILE